MKKHLCIHGHFYQPPREDPWLFTILPEGSAAPFVNWNERITRESYTPLAFARRMDGGGKIFEIVNCYELISFNAGPTLLSWMERAAPETLAKMTEADKKSAARLGHGNAIAQIYHHVIMPLASPRDKELETAWAVSDFIARFGRQPEGIWLSETACDVPTLEVLAANGLAFTILSPYQAKAVAPLESQAWREVNQGTLDIRQPYLVELPSGRSISVFFYDAPLSQAVAFERLLADGENFFNRLSQAAGPGLLGLATDGETYGHHFKFGEMALAYVLTQAASGRGDLALTNFAAYLSANPPAMKARIHEPSAWSCAHGVERWRSDCGCTTGGHPGFNQRWRAPLREALSAVKTGIDAHFDKLAKDLFADPHAALVDYGRVLAGLDEPAAFEAAHLAKGLTKAQAGLSWKLLSMQQWGLASQASCAWFFDEISRLEPVNGLTFALRAMELAKDTGGPDLEPRLTEILAMAPSNIPEYGNGRAIWQTMVKPRLETLSSLSVQAALTLLAEERFPAKGGSATVDWPGASVNIEADVTKNGTKATAQVCWRLECGLESVRLGLPKDRTDGLLDIPVTADAGQGPLTFRGNALPWNKRQAIADAFVTAASGRLFERALDLAGTGLSLIPEIQEAQETLTLAPLWVTLWPGLALAYVGGAPLPEKSRSLLVAFLTEAAANNPAGQEVRRRIERGILGALTAPDPDFAALAGRIKRAQAIGVAPDLWAVQNALWDMRPLSPQAAALASLAGLDPRAGK